MEIYGAQLFEILMQEGRECRVRFSDEKHPVFLAHFEGSPLLPAFLQIDLGLALFGIEAKGVKRAKFIRPIFPRDEVCFRLDSANLLLLSDAQGQAISKIEFFQ